MVRREEERETPVASFPFHLPESEFQAAIENARSAPRSAQRFRRSESACRSAAPYDPSRSLRTPIRGQRTAAGETVERFSLSKQDLNPVVSGNQRDNDTAVLPDKFLRFSIYPQTDGNVFRADSKFRTDKRFTLDRQTAAITPSMSTISSSGIRSPLCSTISFR